LCGQGGCLYGGAEKEKGKLLFPIPADIRSCGTVDRSFRFSEVMVKTDTQTVARLLREYAHRVSLRGGNPYRAKAYATAADTLAALSQPLDRVIAAGTLTELPGIGE
jgi:hypothetical protein